MNNQAAEDQSQSSKKEAAGLLKQAADAGLPASCLDPIVRHVVPAYDKANKAAKRAQRLHRCSAVGVYLLSAASVSVAVIQYVVWHDLYPIVWLEVAALMIACVLILADRRMGWRRRWVEQRHLAEQMRTLMFIPLIKSPLDRRFGPRIGDTTIRPIRPTDPAVRQLLTHKELRFCQVGTDNAHALAKFLAKAWIGDQAKWHLEKAETCERFARQTHRIALALIFLTLVSASLHALGVGHSRATHDVPTTHIDGAEHEYVEHEPATPFGIAELTVILSIALPAWAVAVHGIKDLMDWEPTARRSLAVGRRLGPLADRAKHARDLCDLRHSVDEAERIMLAEHLDWLDHAPTGPEHPA